MKTNRSGRKELSVAKARHFMHEMFKRGMEAAANGAAHLDEDELTQLRLDNIRQVLQESN